jgi:hypothetical protein
VLEEHAVLTEEATVRKETDPANYWLAELIEETDRMAESVCSMEALLRAATDQQEPASIAAPGTPAT